MILGVTRKTGFEGRAWNDKMAVGFFVFGFFMILSAVFLFNATTPYGAINEVNNSYANNITAAIYDDTGSYVGIIYFTMPVASQTTTYQTNAGPGIANLVFYVMAVLGTVYAILWGLMLLKDAFNKKKQAQQDDNGWN